MMDSRQYFAAGNQISGGHPRIDPEGYPYDWDASQRYTRYADYSTAWPWPDSIGGVQSTLPLFDAFSQSQAVRSKGVMGPWLGGSTWAGGNPLNYALQPVAMAKVRG